MFYLTKFCRICVKPGDRLLELSRPDYDCVTFEEKLEACTRMVVGKEDPSPHICAACVRKLRISYDFRGMCLRSDGIIRDYVAELLGEEKAPAFENADLRIVVSPMPDCALEAEMEKYLESVGNKETNRARSDDVCHQNQPDIKPNMSSILFQNLQYGNRCRPTYHQQGVVMKREITDVTQECSNSVEVRVPKNPVCEDPYLHRDRESPMSSQSHHLSSHPAPASKKQDTLSFKGCKRKRVSKDQRCSLLRKFLSNNSIPTNKSLISASYPRIARISIPHALSKKKGGLKDLLGFIKGYDFGYELKANATEQSQETPLDKLESFSKTFFYSDFGAYRDTILAVIKSNETETSDDDDMLSPFDEDEDRRLWFGDVKHETNIKQEPAEETVADTEEVYLEPEVHVKTELLDENEEEYLPSELVQACYSEEGAPKPHEPPTLNNNNFPTCYPSTSGVPSSLEMLQRFTNWAKRGGRKVISPNSLKCRTRGRPFINPQLMEQFKSRSFKCDKCHRSFKSLGYLQSHCTKMGH